MRNVIATYECSYEICVEFSVYLSASLRDISKCLFKICSKSYCVPTPTTQKQKQQKLWIDKFIVIIINSQFL
jgi:hypothetical protein